MQAEGSNRRPPVWWAVLLACLAGGFLAQLAFRHMEQQQPAESGLARRPSVNAATAASACPAPATAAACPTCAAYSPCPLLPSSPPPASAVSPTPSPASTTTPAAAATPDADAAAAAELLVIVYANMPGQHVCNFIESAVRNGVRVAVVGWEPARGPHPDSHVYYWPMKIIQYHDFLNSSDLRAVYPDSTTFIIADYDQVLQWGPRDIMARYRVAMARPWMEGKQMVMSTEKHCSLICPSDPPVPAPPGAPWRYMNSGGAAGTRAGMLDLYGRLRPLAGPDRHHTIGINDQEAVAKAWQAGYPLKLDYYLDLFLSMHQPDETSPIDPATGHGTWRGELLLLEGGVNKVGHAKTGAIPAFVHWNGPSKTWLGEYGYPQLLPRLDYWLRRRGDKSRPDIPASAFARLVHVYDVDLQRVHGLQPEHMCPASPQPLVDEM